MPKNLDDDRFEEVIISVLENRAREVCICRMDLSNRSNLEVYLISDSHSYVESIATIKELKPTLALLHDKWKNSVIANKIEKLASSIESFQTCYISRQYFDQDKGVDLLKKIIIGNFDSDLLSKYTVLAGSYCLLRYIENMTSCPFQMQLKICRIDMINNAISGKVNIDRMTVINLELVSNIMDGTSRKSLFGAINQTQTIVGRRLLRSNILRPLKACCPDLDRMINGFIVNVKSISVRSARRDIDTIIFLRGLIKISNFLKLVLQQLGSGCEIIPTALEALSSPHIDEISLEISRYLDERSSIPRSIAEERNSECFAIKNGLNMQLDISRKNFCDAVEKIHNLAENYCEKYKIPIKVVYSASRGYYLNIPSSTISLPPEFIQAVMNKRFISCTTEDILSLSDFCSDSISQALVLTSNSLQELLVFVRYRIETIFSVVDTIALLDMLCSFASLVLGSRIEFSRPQITNRENNEDILIIHQGRHPIKCVGGLDQNECDFVPNDCFMGLFQSMLIISGPNGSGKTVYIKQVALLVIMAQIGCYLPCAFASIPIRDRILSRIGTWDDLENNLSAFSVEMSEVSYILENVSSRSLILIDELGRGTSNIDGISIAIAIAEHLLSTSSFILFVTHYYQITHLADSYFNAKNIHFDTSVILPSDLLENEDSRSPMKYDLQHYYRILDGPCDFSCGYGIILAETLRIPQSVTDFARFAQGKLRDRYSALFCHFDKQLVEQAVGTLLQNILFLRDSTIDNSRALKYLSHVQDSFSSQLLSGVKVFVNNLLNSNPINMKKEDLKKFSASASPSSDSDSQGLEDLSTFTFVFNDIGDMPIDSIPQIQNELDIQDSVWLEDDIPNSNGSVSCSDWYENIYFCGKKRKFADFVLDESLDCAPNMRDRIIPSISSTEPVGNEDIVDAI